MNRIKYYNNGTALHTQIVWGDQAYRGHIDSITLEYKVLNYTGEVIVTGREQTVTKTKRALRQSFINLGVKFNKESRLRKQK